MKLRPAPATVAAGLLLLATTAGVATFAAVLPISHAADRPAISAPLHPAPPTDTPVRVTGAPPAPSSAPSGTSTPAPARAAEKARPRVAAPTPAMTPPVAVAAPAPVAAPAADPTVQEQLPSETVGRQIDCPDGSVGTQRSDGSVACGGRVGIPSGETPYPYEVPTDPVD